MTMHTKTTTTTATAMTDFKGSGDGFGDIHSDIDNDYFIVIIEILMASLLSFQFHGFICLSKYSIKLNEMQNTGLDWTTCPEGTEMFYSEFFFKYVLCHFTNVRS